jgi:hypothetical protein
VIESVRENVRLNVRLLERSGRHIAKLDDEGVASYVQTSKRFRCNLTGGQWFPVYSDLGGGSGWRRTFSLIGAVHESLERKHRAGLETFPSLWGDLPFLRIPRKRLFRVEETPVAGTPEGHEYDILVQSHSEKTLLFSTRANSCLKESAESSDDPLRRTFERWVPSVPFKRLTETRIIEDFVQHPRLGLMPLVVQHDAVISLLSNLADMAAHHGQIATRMWDRANCNWLDSMPMVPCHGDLHHWNIIATPNGPVIFDFDGITTKPAWVDSLYLTLMSLARLHKEWELQESMTKALRTFVEETSAAPLPLHWRRDALGALLQYVPFQAQALSKLTKSGNAWVHR